MKQRNSSMNRTLTTLYRASNTLYRASKTLYRTPTFEPYADVTIVKLAALNMYRILAQYWLVQFELLSSWWIRAATMSRWRQTCHTMASSTLSNCREIMFEPYAAVKMVICICLLLHHDVICFFRYRFCHRKELHNLLYSNSYVNDFEVLTYVVRMFRNY